LSLRGGNGEYAEYESPLSFRECRGISEHETRADGDSQAQCVSDANWFFRRPGSFSKIRVHDTPNGLVF
jgi:hypothetical protein